MVFRSPINSQVGSKYSQDLGIGKVASIKLDPASGDMKTVFIVDDRTRCLVGLIGTKDRRVMLTSNQHHDFPFEPTICGDANRRLQRAGQVAGRRDLAPSGGVGPF
jgi:hypothetical protein